MADRRLLRCGRNVICGAIDDGCVAMAHHFDSQPVPASMAGRISGEVKTKRVLRADSLGNAAEYVREARRIPEEIELAARAPNQFSEIERVSRNSRFRRVRNEQARILLSREPFRRHHLGVIFRGNREDLNVRGSECANHIFKGEPMIRLARPWRRRGRIER